VVTLFVYLILFGTALIIVVSLLDSWVTVEGETTVFGFGAGVLAAGLAVATFSPFQRFIERRLLGMPVPPEELLPRFIDRIASSPGRMELGHQLRDEVLASLLVRESALLHYNLDAAADILYTTLPAAQLPVLAEARAALTAAAGRYLAPDDKTLAPFPWVRLVVPLQFGSQPTGVWLFGRRDPDDFYSQRDIQFLQTLAQQTSTALANIVQAERLQALYRSDIDRAEEERRRMARELHDQVLGRLALLKVGPGHTPESDALLEEVINRLRDTVAELRPALLEYGLGKALGSLATDDTQPPIVVELPASAARYDAGVELHLFRIVQQACQNARQHAQARLVRVSGRCDPEQIELLVQDDGVGLPVEARRGLAGMVAQRHFGLAGMVERAALVGAQVKFDSTPGNGTRVSILWRRRPD
jgi:signal transduction histidine kinase